MCTKRRTTVFINNLTYAISKYVNLKKRFKLFSELNGRAYWL